jgi:hypothetical protein
MNLIPKRRYEGNPTETGSMMQGTLDRISIRDLSVGTLNAVMNLGSGAAIQSAASGTRISITAAEIAGYNGATKQFYLSASDGKAYAGAGAVTLDSSGITIDGSVSLVALRLKNGANTAYFSKHTGGTTGGVQLQMPNNTDSFTIVFGTGSSFFIDNDNHIMYWGSTLTAINPYSVGTCDLGTSVKYFNEINYKTLTDRGCPMPMVDSALDSIKNMRTKKRKMTIEDADKEGMGSRAKKRILKSTNKELEEIDLSTYPEEILSIPTQKDRDDAERDYQREIEKAQKHNLDISLIKKDLPKIGICINELVMIHTKAIQELLTRIESLEAK